MDILPTASALSLLLLLLAFAFLLIFLGLPDGFASRVQLPGPPDLDLAVCEEIVLQLVEEDEVAAEMDVLQELYGVLPRLVSAHVLLNHRGLSC